MHSHRHRQTHTHNKDTDTRHKAQGTRTRHQAEREKERKKERKRERERERDNTAHQPRKAIELAKTEASRVPIKTGRTSSVERRAATAERGLALLNGGQVRAAAA